jgi:hypothetical protein
MLGWQTQAMRSGLGMYQRNSLVNGVRSEITERLSDVATG